MKDINQYLRRLQKQLHVAEAAHERAGAAHERAGKELEAFHRLAEEGFRTYRSECEGIGVDVQPFSGGGDKPPRNPNG